MAGRVIGTATVTIKASTEEFRRGLAGIDSQMGTMRGSARRLSTAIGALGLGRLASEAVQFGGNYRVQLDNARAAVEGLVTEEDKANELLKEMTEFAINTPFKLPGVQDAAAQLLAVGEGFGVTSENVLDYVETYGNAIAITGGSEDTLRRVVRNFGQMSSKGKVLGRDMNDLGNAIPGFNAWKTLADGLDVTEVELREFQDAGKLDELVTGDRAVEILTKGIKKMDGAAGAMERKMNTLGGSIEFFKDSMGVALADGLNPFFETLQDVLKDPAIATALEGLIEVFAELANEVIAELAPMLPPLVEAFGEIVRALIPAAPLIGTLVMVFAEMLITLTPVIELIAAMAEGISRLLEAMPPDLLGAIAAALTTLWIVGFGPVGAIVIAVGILATAIYQNWDTIMEKTEGFRQAMADIWGWLFDNILKPVGELVAGIIGFFVELYDVLVGNSIIPDLVNAIIEWFEKLIKFITPIIEAIVTVVTVAWDAIKVIIETVSEAIFVIIETYFNAYKTIITTIVGAIKTVITTVFGAIKTFVSTTVKAIKAVVETQWNIIKSVTTTVWNLIKEAILLPINLVKSLLTGDIEGIKELLSFDGLVGIVTGVWDDVKDAILGPLEDAANRVGGIVDRIKGPISSIGDVATAGGNWNPLNWGAEGGIYTRPTIMGLGEAGAEALIPLTNPMRAMQLMQQSGLDRLASQMNTNRSYDGPLITMPGAVIQDATDADLVAQRTLVAMQAAMVA